MVDSKVVIIILNWNRRDELIECLESVKKINYSNYETIVVDNGSTDGSPQVILERFPWVKLIRNQKNVGVSKARNIGIRYALKNNVDYILLLDNDTVVESQILNHFTQAAKIYPEAKIFGPRVYFYYEPNKIWFGGSRWNEDKLDFHLVVHKVVDDGFSFNEVEEVDVIIICALFFDATLIYKIGFLDERFFLGYEEIDWCLRARRAGFKCLYIPQGKVWHKGGFISDGCKTPFSLYFYWRSRLLWIEKALNFRRRLLLWFDALNTFQRYMRIYFGITPQLWLKGQGVNNEQRLLVKAGIKGMLDYILRRFDAGPKWIYKEKT